MHELTESTTAIDLSHKELKYIPIEIAKNTQLEILFLNNTQLKRLPSNFSNLTNLKILDISNNYLDSLPSDIKMLSDLKYFNAKNNNLTAIPFEIGELINLRKLDLSYNKLTEIPESIKNLTELIFLNLENNNLIFLPDKIGKLKKLKHLDLSDNDWSEIPKNIKKLKKLIFLDISHNEIISLAPIKNSLENVIYFDFSHNKIYNLAPIKNKMKNVRILKMGNNNIKNYAPIKIDIENVEIVNLANNDIKNFAPISIFMKNVKIIRLEGNNKITNYAPINDSLENVTIITGGDTEWTNKNPFKRYIKDTTINNSNIKKKRAFKIFENLKFGKTEINIQIFIHGVNFDDNVYHFNSHGRFVPNYLDNGIVTINPHKRNPITSENSNLTCQISNKDNYITIQLTNMQQYKNVTRTFYITDKNNYTFHFFPIYKDTTKYRKDYETAINTLNNININNKRKEFDDFIFPLKTAKLTIADSIIKEYTKIENQYYALKYQLDSIEIKILLPFDKYDSLDITERIELSNNIKKLYRIRNKTDYLYYLFSYQNRWEQIWTTNNKIPHFDLKIDSLYYNFFSEPYMSEHYSNTDSASIIYIIVHTNIRYYNNVFFKNAKKTFQHDFFYENNIDIINKNFNYITDVDLFIPQIIIKMMQKNETCIDCEYRYSVIVDSNIYRNKVYILYQNMPFHEE